MKTLRSETCWQKFDPAIKCKVSAIEVHVWMRTCWNKLCFLCASKSVAVLPGSQISANTIWQCLSISGLFFDVSPLQAEHDGPCLPAPHLYHTAPCWERQGKKQQLIIQPVLLKQRGDERSSLSVMLFLSGCRCKAAIKGITDCFPALLERGSTFEDVL